ncbi:MAG: hypothetical protein M3H12_05990, partial [Chromatiales bacterium]
TRETKYKRVKRAECASLRDGSVYATRPSFHLGNLSVLRGRFKKQFQYFLDASKKADASDKVKIAMLLRTVGEKGNDRFDNFTFPTAELA